MNGVRVTLEDAPIHCVDILDTKGMRMIRIRPEGDGSVKLELTSSGGVWLDSADTRELAAALDRLAES